MRQIISTEPVHGPPSGKLVLAVCALAASVLALLLTACGAQPAKVSTASNGVTTSPACLDWQRSGGTGELAQMQEGIKAIKNDMRIGSAQALQVDGLAMSAITGMDVIQNAPPVLPRSWASMVLDLNKAGEALVGGDIIGASGNLALADAYASELTRALHKKCGF